MKKKEEIFKLRVYNNPEINFLDAINAFKSIGFTTLQSEQCAIIVHSTGKYDLIEGNLYELDSIRVNFYNLYRITSEILPVKQINKPNNVMEEKQTTSLFNDMKNLWSDFESSHNDYAEKGTKKSAAKARKSIQALKSLITTYRKTSVEECKA